MSTTVPSAPPSGYSTSISATSSSTSLPSTSSKALPKPKPTNVFSDDGSFLERFQRSKKDEEDKHKAEEALLKKKQFADRFKNRGKRPQPHASPSVTSTDTEGNPTKKAKVEDPPSTGCKKEVHDYSGQTLKEPGTSVPPLVR